MLSAPPVLTHCGAADPFAYDFLRLQEPKTRADKARHSLCQVALPLRLQHLKPLCRFRLLCYGLPPVLLAINCCCCCSPIPRLAGS